MTPLRLLGSLVAALVVAVLAGNLGTATAGRSACTQGAGGSGYAYAGHQAASRAHGVRATISPVRALHVDAGHVAGWVGVGGPGQGPNGEDAWIQAGIASVEGSSPYLYAEITRAGRDPQFILLDDSVQVGERRNVAVSELSGRPGWWRVSVDGEPVTKPVLLRGSSGRWAPIATAESWNGGEAACNTFAYRFERVSVSGEGGSWRQFVPGHRFLDKGHRLRALATAAAGGASGARRLSSGAPLPYAFLASSG